MAYTSTIFGCWRALLEACEQADFGAHPANPDGTLVHFGFPDDKVELGQEHVVVIGGLIAPATQDPFTFAAGPGGGRRSEKFGMPVFARVRVDGLGRNEVMDRLEQIGAALEQVIRVDFDQKPQVGGVLVPGTNWWAVSSVMPRAFGGPNGHIGELEIIVAVQAHI